MRTAEGSAPRQCHPSVAPELRVHRVTGLCPLKKGNYNLFAFDGYRERLLVDCLMPYHGADLALMELSAMRNVCVIRDVIMVYVQVQII